MEDLEYTLKNLITLCDSLEQLEHTETLINDLAYRLSNDELKHLLNIIKERKEQHSNSFKLWIDTVFEMRKVYGIHNHIQPTHTIRVYEPKAETTNTN